MLLSLSTTINTQFANYCIKKKLKKYKSKYERDKRCFESTIDESFLRRRRWPVGLSVVYVQSTEKKKKTK